MKKHLAMLATVLATAANPVHAASLSCADWLAYRSGDRALAAQGLIFETFLQGYLDGVNAFAEVFDGNLIAESSPGKFVPSAPARPLTIEYTVAVLDQACTADWTADAYVLGIVEVNTQMQRSADPVLATLMLLLSNLNKAKGERLHGEGVSDH
jgi:hypothetical protein